MVDCYVGEIRTMATSVVPEGWHDCDGSVLPINGNEALYALLGTLYGGDGAVNFGLPDLRGRLMISQGQGVGMTNRTLGSKGGTETVTMIPDQLPAHTHTFNTAGVTATVSTPSNSVTLANTQPPVIQYLNANVAGTGINLANTSITNSGSGMPHANMMPTVALRFIIATRGLFPTSN